MEYTKLGSTGVEVSKLCFGTWRFNSEAEDGTIETTREQAHELLDTARDHGINFIDTANTYGGGESERWIGDWLTDHDREEYVIASKVFWTEVSPVSGNLSRKTIRAEIQGTLDRLDTDYLDVYYIHRWDDETLIRETLRTLNELVREGKVHYLGASSMAAWQLTKALWTSDVHDIAQFQITQPRFNAADREHVGDYLDLCADQDLAVCPYSPLEGGFLTDKYQRTEDGAVTGPQGSRADLYNWNDRWSDRQWETLDTIRTVAEEKSATTAQVALQWLMIREAFTCVPIIGARTPEQLAENAAATDIDLSLDQQQRIDAAYNE